MKYEFNLAQLFQRKRCLKMLTDDGRTDDGPRSHWYTIGIAHVFSCINVYPVSRKLFEHEAVRPIVQTSSKGPGKC